jgi:hypothetical protein
MTLYRALFYEPGHFHAALTLRTPNPRLAPDIHVYATPGPERDAFLTLVERFNTRADHPTRWRLHLHDGAHLLQRVVEERQGDFVVVAGRNDTKLETLAYLTQAGLPVLADKPWLTESRQLPFLAQVTAGPRVAMDLMTGSYSLRAQVIAQVIHTPELFGAFVTHEDPEPAIELASVHHLYKQVNGRPLQRPGWYYDTAVQGDGGGLEPILKRVLAQWQERFPGLACTPAACGVRLQLPSALDQGHESHFALALNAFLDHLDRGVWPEALRARLRLRYTLLARARDLALRESATTLGPVHGP